MASGPPRYGGDARVGDRSRPASRGVGFLAAFGFILASYVTKEFAIRHGRSYPNDAWNRLKRRDLRLLLICLGALIGRPFEALALAGLLSHVCVVGILIKGWARSATTDDRKTA